MIPNRSRVDRGGFIYRLDIHVVLASRRSMILKRHSVTALLLFERNKLEGSSVYGARDQAANAT